MDPLLAELNSGHKQLPGFAAKALGELGDPRAEDLTEALNADVGSTQVSD